MGSPCDKCVHAPNGGLRYGRITRASAVNVFGRFFPFGPVLFTLGSLQIGRSNKGCSTMTEKILAL